MRVAYYNGVKGNTGADVITTEDVKRYFQEYLDGDSTHISEFYNTLTPSNNTQNDNYKGSSIDEFERKINNTLDEGVTTSTATPEQMEEAIKKTMLDYETGKYRDAVDSPLEQDDKKNRYQEFIDSSPEQQEFIDSSPELDDNH